MDYIASALRDKYGEDRLFILAAKRNAGSFTYDGIELGGERVASEIEETLGELARNGHNIKKLSIVGYSLGGLVARYAIGLLQYEGWFEKLKAVNFTTFATPHLGVRTPLTGVTNQLWNILGARTLSTSGRQLFMIDSFRNTGRPLLSLLADPDSIFMRALAKFECRCLYANIVNDRSAVYYTTGISRIDPFTNLNKIDVNYAKGYEPVVLDRETPVQPHKETELPTFYKRFAGGSQTFFSTLPIYAFLIVFIPIGSVLFLINSGVQTMRSRQRIRLHEQGKTGVRLGGYRVPLMVQDVRSAVEEAFESVNAGQEQEYLPDGSEEMVDAIEEPSSPRIQDRDRPSLDRTLSEKSSSESELTKPRQPEFPTLALTSAQFAMVNALDDIGFRKYPVYIHKVRHTHAAIIVRMPKDNFEEGKVVVMHWLQEEFQI